jgi:hypothetical protein
VEVRDGIAVAPFLAVVGEGVSNHTQKRFGDVEFRSCPLASVVAPGCPTAAGELPWVRDVVEALYGVSVGLALSDVVGRPTKALTDGIVTLDGARRHSAEWNPGRSGG